MIEEKQLLDSALSHTRRVLDFSPYKSYSGITSREEFQDLLSKDPAFSALGLDDERYVIARVGGNLITSLHRRDRRFIRRRIQVDRRAGKEGKI